MKQIEKEAAIQAQKDIIRDREGRLKSKDYIGTKIAMGVATVEEYANEIAETELWRKDIRDAKSVIAELNNTATEVEDIEAMEG